MLMVNFQYKSTTTTNRIHHAGSPLEHFTLVSFPVFLGHFVVRRLLAVGHRLPDFPASSADVGDADGMHRVFLPMLFAAVLGEEDERRPTALGMVQVLDHDVSMCCV